MSEKFRSDRNFSVPNSINLFYNSLGEGEYSAKPSYTRKLPSGTLDDLVAYCFGYRGSSSGTIYLSLYDSGNMYIPQGTYHYNFITCGASEGTKNGFLTLFPLTRGNLDTYTIRVSTSSSTAGFIFTYCERHIRRDATLEPQWDSYSAIRFASGPGGMIVGNARLKNTSGSTFTGTLACRTLPSPAWGELYFPCVGTISPTIRLTQDASTGSGLMYLNGSLANNSTVFCSFAYISNDPRMYYTVTS